MAEEEPAVVAGLPSPDSEKADAATEEPVPAFAGVTASAEEQTGDAKSEEVQKGNGSMEDTRRELTETRIQRLLTENKQLCKELSQVHHDLDKARLTEEELQVTWRGASNVFSRQKLNAENLQKRTQQQSRVELQRLAESAKQLSELRSVHSQLQSVNRQLDFAVNLQSTALTQCENKIAARTRRIRKLELAIYHLIAEAQCHPILERSVAGLVSKCGPLVHNVLSREAQRQAMELAEREDAAREGRDIAAS
jgi:hypothetical protein